MFLVSISSTIISSPLSSSLCKDCHLSQYIPWPESHVDLPAITSLGHLRMCWETLEWARLTRISLHWTETKLPKLSFDKMSKGCEWKMPPFCAANLNVRLDRAVAEAWGESGRVLISNSGNWTKTIPCFSPSVSFVKSVVDVIVWVWRLGIPTRDCPEIFTLKKPMPAVCVKTDIARLPFCEEHGMV